MERVMVSRPFVGLCGMQVCACKDVTDVEILEVCNRENPAGTSNGWCEVIREEKQGEKATPVQCADHPDRLHFLVIC